MSGSTNPPSTARRRLWVVSELYYPEQTSTGYFLTEIAEGLAADFEVRAVCGQPTYSSAGIVAPQREVRNGVSIYRMRGTRFPKDRLFLRSEEHTSELQSLMRISYAVFCLKKKNNYT